jgi:cytochrome P450
MLGNPTVFLIGPSANQWLFENEDVVLENRWSSAIRQLLGADSVSMLNGPAHRRRRKLLQPHFTRAAAGSYAPLVESLARRHFEAWADRGGVLRLADGIRVLAFDVAMTLVFGPDHQIDQPRLLAHFQRWAAGMFPLIAAPIPGTAFAHALASRRVLLATLQALVVERRRLAQQPPDILGSLIESRDENGAPLSDTTIADEILVQLFAGHDTTVAALTNSLFLLAQHDHVRTRVREELDAAGGPLDLAALERLPYLTQVIHESLRAVPPVAAAFRVTIADTSFGGFRIPKGWTLVMSVIGSAHNPDVWREPARFDPTRFDARGQGPCRHAAIPFGGGPRVCLGQNFALAELRLMLAMLLEGYEWPLLEKQDLRYRLFPFPLPRSGVRVRFARRRRTSPK